MKSMEIKFILDLVFHFLFRQHQTKLISPPVSVHAHSRTRLVFMRTSALCDNRYFRLIKPLL